MSIDFSRLPVDMQKMVTSNISPQDLSKMSPCSKLFQKMASDSPAWKMVGEKCKLKNLTKENARSKVLEHYQSIEIVKKIALKFFPEGVKRVNTKCWDITSLQMQIVGKDDDLADLEHLLHDACYLLTEEDSKAFTENMDELTRLHTIVGLIKENKSKDMFGKLTTLIYTIDFHRAQVVLLFLKVGAYDVATSQQFFAAINIIVNQCSSQNPYIGEVLSELLNALDNHPGINDKSKAEILDEILLYITIKEVIIGKEYLAILMKHKGPTYETMEKAVRFYISKGEKANDLLGEYVRHSHLQSSELNRMVDRIRQEKPYDNKHNEICNKAQQVIDKVLQERESTAKEKVNSKASSAAYSAKK